MTVLYGMLPQILTPQSVMRNEAFRLIASRDVPGIMRNGEVKLDFGILPECGPANKLPTVNFRQSVK